MGPCSSANKKSSRIGMRVWNKRLGSSIKKVEDQVLDELLTNCTNFFGKIETLREKFSNPWNKLTELTGTYVLPDPTITKCIECAMFRFSFELTKDTFITIEILSSDPWIKFDKSKEFLLTQDCQDYIKNIKTVLTELSSIRQDADDLHKEFSTVFNQTKAVIDKFSYDQLTPVDREAKKETVGNNYDNVKLAFDIISTINSIVSKLEPDLEEVGNFVKQKEYLEGLARIGPELLKMKTFDPKIAVMKYYKEKSA